MFNKKLKQENARLTQELLDVKQELLYYQNENRVLRDKKDYCDKQVILLNAQVFDLKERLKQTDFDELNKKLAFSRQELTKVNEECYNKSIELNQLKTDLVCLNDKFIIQELGLYDLPNDIQYYKDELNTIRKQESQILIDNKYFSFLQQWIVNGNTRQGELFGKFLARVCITSFNLNFDAIVDKLTITNINNIKNRLEKIYGNYNQTLRENGLMLSMDYYNLKMKELDIILNIVIKKQQDKEELQREKEKIHQQALAEKELEKEKNKLEKELLHYKLQEESGKDVKDKIEELKEKLELNDYKLCHELSGYVYFIVNKSFNNDNWIKCGVTRRLNPYDRISELSSASVPFKFYDLGIVFTDNAYDLENRLHKRLSEFRVNKFNPRKEYFNISIDELENIVNNEFHLGLEFNRNIIDEDWEYSVDKSPKV